MSFDPNAFQTSQFQTPVPAPPAEPPPPLVASDDAISGATRSGISRSDSWPIQNWLLVRVGGKLLDPYENAIEHGTIVVTDNQNETADTCDFMLWGQPPRPGQEIVIAGATFAKRLFGGAVTEITQHPMKPGNPELWAISCTDWWYYANRRRVWAKYLTFPADVILKDLISRFTTGFTYNNVHPAPNITGGITFDGQSFSSCVSELCKRIGWDAYIDTHRDFHFFDVEATKARSLRPRRYHYWDLTFKEGRSQIRNRVYQEGGGGLSTAQVLPGATAIPVDVTSWYPLAGPNMRVVYGGQIIPYTGIVGNDLQVPAGYITHVIPQGSEISIFVQVDDLASQAEQAAIEGGDSDGVYEYTASVDHRLTEEGAIAKAEAELIAFRTSSLSGSYSAYDDEARSGKLVEIHLPYRGAPLRGKRFIIQSVTTRVLGPKRNYVKSISFGTTEKLDIYTALRGGVS